MLILILDLTKKSTGIIKNLNVNIPENKNSSPMLMDTPQAAEDDGVMTLIQNGAGLGAGGTAR